MVCSLLILADTPEHIHSMLYLYSQEYNVWIHVHNCMSAWKWCIVRGHSVIVAIKSLLCLWCIASSFLENNLGFPAQKPMMQTFECFLAVLLRKFFLTKSVVTKRVRHMSAYVRALYCMLRNLPSVRQLGIILFELKPFWHLLGSTLSARHIFQKFDKTFLIVCFFVGCWFNDCFWNLAVYGHTWTIIKMPSE